MKHGYGQYCPLALAAEILCERWTVLIISRLFYGCSTFNEIHRGVPKISPSMLSRRLTDLEEARVLTRHPNEKGTGHTYGLTEAGQALEGLIMQMAIWGQNWARDMTEQDLDPGFLAWSIHVGIDGAAMPPGRTVLEFDFSGCPRDFHRFWLVNKDGEVDMCLKYPGFETDLLVESDLRTFVECWRGLRDIREEIYCRRIMLTGSADLRRAFPEWLMLNPAAPYERKRPGPERELYRRWIAETVDSA